MISRRSLCAFLGFAPVAAAVPALASQSSSVHPHVAMVCEVLKDHLPRGYSVEMNPEFGCVVVGNAAKSLGFAITKESLDSGLYLRQALPALLGLIRASENQQRVFDYSEMSLAAGVREGLDAGMFANFPGGLVSKHCGPAATEA